MRYNVLITDGKKEVAIDDVLYANAFDDVKKGEPVLYVNSLDYVAIALNMDSFADKYGVKYGPDVKISIKKK